MFSGDVLSIRARGWRTHEKQIAQAREASERPGRDGCELVVPLRREYTGRWNKRSAFGRQWGVWQGEVWLARKVEATYARDTVRSDS